MIFRFSLSSLSNLKIPVEHVPNGSSHKKVNVLNRLMEDEFICITFKTISQTKLIDLMWTLNWLIDCCFYYFTAWLSRYIATCTRFASFSRFSWVTISVVQKKLSIKFWSDFEIKTQYASPRRGGGTPLYKLYRYVPPYRVGFLRRFGLKTSIHFAHVGLESGMVFEGTTGVYERIYRFNSKWVRKGGGEGRRRNWCEFQMDLKNFLFAL